MVCVFSFTASCILCNLDQKQDNEENYVEDNSGENSEFGLESFKAIGKLNSMFWLLSFVCCALYSAVLPFNYIASGFLTRTVFKDVKDKALAQEKAGMYMSIPFVISGFLVPLFGYTIDKVGQRAYLAVFSSIMGLIAFSSLYYINPLYSLILIGVTYSLFASVIWPAISLVVKKNEIVNNIIY